MYDELVKRLWECASGECFNCSQYKPTTNASVCQKELIKQAADATEELGKPKWIPVTERLPEHSYGESNSVLTVSRLGAMRVLYFDGGNWCYPTGEALTTAGKFPVTHWMPLPEPPKEE